jgi:C-terminal processing protease CtpA/Prc
MTKQTVRDVLASLIQMRASAFFVGLAATLAIGVSIALQAQSELTPAAVQADFDALWRNVSENYAYFDSRLTDWSAVPDLYRSDLASVKTRSELIAVFERVLDELYDAHAQLTVNTAQSPRLVPSGADVWAEWQQGRAIVGEVREDSDAQRSGIRAGAEILTLDDVPIAEALRARIGRSLRAVDDRVRSWALRAALAGNHNQERRIRFRIGGSVSTVSLPAADQFVNREVRLASRTLPNNVGYIRLSDSLGDSSVIGDFDSALARYESTAALILDLRDTPGGGNTAVARAILGRFVRTEKPYQKHVLPSEERETGVRRSWLELVTPRGPFLYPHPVIVLVGHWTGSMGEGLAIGFDAADAATIVGTPMAQLLGATYHFELPQSHFGMNLPAEKLFHVNGTPREAFVAKVQLTLQDLMEPGGDPWMTKAMQVLNDHRR